MILAEFGCGTTTSGKKINITTMDDAYGIDLTISSAGSLLLVVSTVCAWLLEQINKYEMLYLTP